MDRGNQKRSRYEECLLTAIHSSLFLELISFSVPWGCSHSLSHRPERDFFNAFTASWSQIQPSFQLTYLVLSHPPYLQQWHCLSHFCPCCFSMLKRSSITSIWCKITLPWKLLASAQPKLKSPVFSFCSGCNQDRFFFTNKNGAEINFNAEVSLSSLACWPQCFSKVSAANWFVIKQKHGVFD